MTDKITEPHCSFWGGIPQEKLTNANRLHIGIIVNAFKKGPWNIPTNWDRIEFGDEVYTRFPVATSLATFDFDQLTRLVFLAHDNHVRVELSPCNFKNIYIRMWSRNKRGARYHQIHPTLESAVVEYRKTDK